MYNILGTFTKSHLIVMLEDLLDFNVLEACVAIIATLLGAAYPLFLNLFKDINSTYSSNLILTEVKREPTFIWFRRLLVISLIVLFICVCGFKPLFLFNIKYLDFIINNSAEILLLMATIFLVINFLLFIRNSFKFYQPYETATELIRRYKESIQED